MKNIYILLFLFLLSNCTQDKTEVDIYLEDNFPKVLNLSSSEINDFKNSMVFNEDGALSSWDNNILRKAYDNDDEYNKVITNIVAGLGGDISKPIVVVDDSNQEYIIEQTSIKDINNKEYSISEIKEWKSMFLFTSTTCGTCIRDFNKYNNIAKKYKNKDIKFVALIDNISNLENYKKGVSYKNFGFLDENWIIFSKEPLLEELTDSYNDSLGFPYIFFRKDNTEVGNIYDVEEVENNLKLILD